ncbi:hypothetical protein [Fluviicola chungangensis]|uniref:Uncharacterized protein n=1 Tax=Fluviicola chungangensis TaxID=2597671 RepID=A0A556MQ25_9FLAO|nr:hypothetical protein [Fluviicola chungangensis]TSJ41932.1 hypothetical protein FO442_12635 [Fluviicola chungangensis]
MKASETSKTNLNWFQKQIASFERSRFGAMAALLTAQSCFGSVAAMYSLKTQSYVLLAICANITMASNGAFIAQVSAKWCLILFYLSVILNLGILIINFFIR